MASGNGQRKPKSAGGDTNLNKTAGTAKTKKTQTYANTKSSGKQNHSGKNSGGKASVKLSDEVALLVILACAIILILSNFNLAGSVGRGIKWFMFGILGIVQYIFPVVLIVSIFYMVANKDIIRVIRIKTAAAYILCILLSALWQRITNEPDIRGSASSFFISCAEHKNGGGFLGGMLCKILSPLGFAGSLVILAILMIICVVVITEKSFISGLKNMQNSGSKIVHEAREDYSAYKEHSVKYQQQEQESEEEYRIRREEERAQARIKKLEKKERAIAQKKAKEEKLAKARMNNVVRGVTKDLSIPIKPQEEQDIDIREIMPVSEGADEYSEDIYDPSTESRRLVERSHERQDEAAQEKPSRDADIKLSIKEDDAGAKLQERHSEPEESHDHADNPVAEAFNNNEQEIVGAESVQEKKQKAYQFPPVSLLNKNSSVKKSDLDKENRNTAIRLQQTLQNFGVKVTITNISCGPSITRYELQPEQGVKVSKIVSLSDDIKLNLAAADIRIEAPIPGKSAVGIEVPNKEASSVFLRELLETDVFKKSSSKISFAAGKDIAGKVIVADIAKMPHLLIAGATGSGKSVCINTIIMSILYKARPDEVKMIMVDPKVVELSVYNGIPHLLLPVVTDPKKAAGALNWAVNEMSDRYKKFAALNVRNLEGYNDAVGKIETKEGETPVEKLPQIVIIVDELADLMMVAPGEVEDAICRLAQLARAAGIHMVIATQRPSVNVITGLIKANVPSRIAFSVSSGVDSRTILDMNGAEKLLGKGDMLYFPSSIPKPVRVQGAFVSDGEIAKVVEFLKQNNDEEVVYDESIANTVLTAETAGGSAGDDGRDSLFEEAGRFVIDKEKGSIGMLQRQFKIGFNRAGRIMDQLSDAGVVGPELGTKPRKVMMTQEEFESYLKGSQ